MSVILRGSAKLIRQSYNEFIFKRTITSTQVLNHKVGQILILLYLFNFLFEHFKSE